MKLFIDTHDKTRETFPAEISDKDLLAFYKNYCDVFEKEGVVIVRTFIGKKDGRAFCLNLAESEEAVRRAHEKAGLPFDSITEVAGISPADLLWDK